MTADYTPARIRVEREGLEELLEALSKHVYDLRDGRDTVRGSGTEPVGRFNRRIKDTRRVISEALRTQREMGWFEEPHDGEPEQSDPA